jgi:hypothetical protein
LLRSKNITTSRPSKKMDVRYLGPFTVTKKIGKLAYRLDLPPSMARIHPVFNIALLEPWHEPFEFAKFIRGRRHPRAQGDHGKRPRIQSQVAGMASSGLHLGTGRLLGQLRANPRRIPGQPKGRITGTRREPYGPRTAHGHTNNSSPDPRV